MIFRDREEAGRLLAKELRGKLKPEDKPILLAIPRGGIPVAFAIASELKIPVSVVVVRKLGLPWNEEAGFGAIDPEGRVYLDEKTVSYANLTPEAIEAVAEKELRELKEREKKFLREGYPDLKDRHAVIVDDGMATGYTAIAASGFAKSRGAKKVTVAVPVCPADRIEHIKKYVDDFLCLHPSTERSFAVGMFYTDFHQLSDEEALNYLKRAEVY